MATNNHEIKIDYKVVNSQFNKGIKEINSEVSTLNKEFKLQQEQMKLTASESEKLEAKLNKLNKEHELGQKKTREIETAYKNVVEIMGESSKEAETWKNKLLDAKKNEEYLKNAIQLTTEALDKSNESMSEAAKESEANKEKLKSLEEQQKSLALESQKLTSELKLEQSELSANATEAEKLEVAKKNLAKQSELVERQIKNLEDQLALTKNEFGENSQEVIELETALNEAKASYNSLTNEIDGVTTGSSEASSGLESMNKMMKADLVMELTDQLSELSQKLIEVGENSIKAAGNRRATDSQFNQVFDGIESQAEDSVNSIGKQMGVLPNRIKPVFTQMAAFAKTTGAEQEDALNLAERATIAAADSAAFYDKSLEDTTESLQSFLKGNYENDAALGISATETTRNAKANELYGQSFNDLSEQQKQLTLLAMVEEGNQLSGALNQAAKESDGLENTLGNLSAAQDEFYNAIGQPVLDEFVALMRIITDMTMKAVEWFNQLPEPVKEFSFVFGGIIAVAGLLLPIWAALGATAAIMGTTIGGLVAAALPIIGTFLAIAAAVAAVILIFKNWGAVSEWLKEAWRLFCENVSAFWDVLKDNSVRIFTAIKDNVVEQFTNAKNIAIEIWDKIASNIKDKIEGAKNAVGKAIDAIKGFFNFEWKWPKIPLPRFTFSGSANPLDWGDSSKRPNIGVEWYAKGGIMTSPTIFGFNGRNIMAGGEAGPEAVIPLNKEVLASIGVGISASMTNETMINLMNEANNQLYAANDKLNGLMEKNTVFEMNGRIVAEEIRADLNDLNNLFNAREFRTRGGEAFA